MELTQFEYCRTCLNVHNLNMRSLTELYTDELKLEDLLMDLLGTWENSIDLPSFLCKTCEEMLIITYLFKKQCLESENKYLEIYLNNTKFEILEENSEIRDENEDLILHDDGAYEIQQLEISLPEKSIDDNNILEEENEGQQEEWENDDFNESIIPKCIKCDLKFTSRQEYNNHYQENHHIYKQNQEEFNEESLNDENTSENNEEIIISNSLSSLKSYRCRKCKLEFKTKKEYCDHYRNSHVEMRVCPKCGKLVKKLSTHLRTHNQKERHFCAECDKSFTSKENLRIHLRLHAGERPYECEYCGKRFTQMTPKIYHIRFKHTKEKNEECPICHKRFIHKGLLNQHLRTHTNERPYECSYCQKKFNTSIILKAHIATHLTVEKNIICKICNKTFAQKKNLSSHMQTHTIKICKICSKECMGYNSLQTHLKSHRKLSSVTTNGTVSLGQEEVELLQVETNC